jgi:hypothetical protein
MVWYRIDDETQGQTVLIEAPNKEEAMHIYLDEYGPNLYVSEAEPSLVDQSAIWFH